MYVGKGHSPFNRFPPDSTNKQKPRTAAITFMPWERERYAQQLSDIQNNLALTLVPKYCTRQRAPSMLDGFPCFPP